MELLFGRDFHELFLELQTFQLILLFRSLALHLQPEDLSLQLLVLRTRSHERVSQGLNFALKTLGLLPQTQVLIAHLDLACVSGLLKHLVLVNEADKLHAYVIVLVPLELEVALQVEVVLFESDKFNLQLFLVIQSLSQLVLQLLYSFGCALFLEVEF